MNDANLAFVFGALNAIGGTIGYVRKGSVPSIIAGCSVGAVYALGGYRLQVGQPYGNELALLASVVLAGSSLPKALNTGAPIPTGLSGLALVGLYVYGSAWWKARGQ